MGRCSGEEHSHPRVLSPASRTGIPFPAVPGFTRISVLNTVLVLITCLWIIPRNLLRKLSWSNCKRFFTDHVLNTRESNLKIVLAIMLGIFMGIVPLWGYQMLITLFLRICSD